jgi:four helix bundle protein
MNSEKNNIVITKSFGFAVRIIKLYQYLLKNYKEHIISRQILRSGTSIGANIEEAHGGVSKADFSNKISIAYKESREVSYWLKLLFATDYINKKMFDSLFKDCDELSRITYSIIKTTRTNSKKRK